MKRLGDTEATKTAGLVHRLRLEASLPQADVFVCGEPLSVAALARRVLLSEGEVLAGRVRGLVVHSDREHAQCPSSWLDLASDRWRDQGCGVTLAMGPLEPILVFCVRCLVRPVSISSAWAE